MVSKPFCVMKKREARPDPMLRFHSEELPVLFPMGAPEVP